MSVAIIIDNTGADFGFTRTKVKERYFPLRLPRGNSTTSSKFPLS
jgi:hypothetical protein